MVVFFPCIFHHLYYNCRLKEFLGSGQFGKVHRGLWFEGGGEYKQEIEKEVAVKSIEQGTSDTDRVKFLQEAAIMGQFCHANVLQLVGIVLTDPVSKSVAIIII